MAKYGRWFRSEVTPLFAVLGVAVGICVMNLGRNALYNPEVRVDKGKRSAGVLDNHDEGKTYSQHWVRKRALNSSAEVMPNVNKFFSNPN